MKDRLTKEQSAHLLALGVPKEKASEELIENIYQAEYNEPRPKIFTLINILQILPKDIRYEELTYILEITWNTLVQRWCTMYTDSKTNALCLKGTSIKWFGATMGVELIDALYELCVWCLENKYIQFD